MLIAHAYYLSFHFSFVYVSLAFILHTYIILLSLFRKMNKTKIDTENTQKQIIKIHPDSIVVAKANLQGNIVIGAGTIIHPQANINAGEGSIVLGSNNIVEETSLIQNLGPAGHVMTIGNDNLFEIGSVCHAREVGNNNIFGIQCMVGPEVRVTNDCRIGARCKLMTDEELPQMTQLRFDHGQRNIASEKPISQKSQTEFLKKLLPKYSEVIRNKEPTTE